MPKSKEQSKAISRIRLPEIMLNEKVLKEIKDLTLDEDVTLVLEGKVVEVSKERDFDFDMPMSDREAGKRPPKVMRARFEISSAKKK